EGTLRTVRGRTLLRVLRMTAWAHGIPADTLLGHVGHDVEVVTYGDPPVNVTIQCETCGEVITDTDLDATDNGPVDNEPWPIHPDQPGPPEPGSDDERAVIAHIAALLVGAGLWLDLLDLDTGATFQAIHRAIDALNAATTEAPSA